MIAEAGESSAASGQKRTRARIPHLRWWVVALIFLASILNYVDRQTLSILAPTIQSDLKLSNESYATVLNLFLVAYTLSYLFSGKLVDKFGVRAGLAVFVAWWSVSNMVTAFARSAGTLGLTRFLLGLGEAGNWTAAPKAVGEWFPARERGLAIGVYTLGGTIGATIAPLLIIRVASWHSWQAAFVFTGFAGLLWLVPWLLLYRRPAEHPYLSERERDLLNAAAAEVPSDSQNGEAWGNWWQLFARREVWLLIFGRMLTDPVWYFFQFWFAKYLYDARAVDQKALSVTWVIFLAADIGAVGGGWFSGRLIRRRFAPAASRIRVMLLCAGLVPAAGLIPLLPGLAPVLALGMIAVLAHMAWLINLSALVVDVVPKASLASVFGIVAAGSSVGGIFMNQAVGWLVTHHSYAPAFYTMFLLHPLAWLLLRPLSPARATAVPSPA